MFLRCRNNLILILLLRFVNTLILPDTTGTQITPTSLMVMTDNIISFVILFRMDRVDYCWVIVFVLGAFGLLLFLFLFTLLDFVLAVTVFFKGSAVGGWIWLRVLLLYVVVVGNYLTKCICLFILKFILILRIPIQFPI